MSTFAPQITTIFLATDHAGFESKEVVKEWLLSEGFSVNDCGAHRYDPEDDYPDFIAVAAHAVSNDKSSVGIIFGGSGQGEAMMSNRYQGVRAVAYYGGETAIITLSRQHNGANVLSFGARFVSIEEMKHLIRQWLSTPVFIDPKYERRAKQMDEIVGA